MTSSTRSTLGAIFSLMTILILIACLGMLKREVDTLTVRVAALESVQTAKP